MADEAKAPSPEELIKNHKAEMDRKVQPLVAKMDELTRANASLLARLDAATQKVAQPIVPKAKPMNDVWYDDPIEAARRVKEEAKNEIREEFNQRDSAQQRRQEELVKLVQEYPELNDTSVPLNQRAVDIYNALPEADKANPMAYRLAVKEAASELGMKPKSKRTSDDSFTISGGTSKTTRPSPDSGEESDVMTIAKLMGVDVTDEKTRERLQTRAKRNYGKWQSE